MNVIITIGREYGSGGKYIGELVSKKLDISEYLKRNRIGALIVIERDMSLQEYITPATKVYADLTSPLLGTIFFSFILTIIIIFKAGKHLEESITSYASIETKRVATSILNDVIRNYDFTKENLYKIVKNDSKEIEFIDIEFCHREIDDDVDRVHVLCKK